MAVESVAENGHKAGRQGRSCECMGGETYDIGEL